MVETQSAPPSHGQHEPRGPIRSEKTAKYAGRSIVVTLVPNARRARTNKPKAGGEANDIIQRTPDIILDTRLNDTGNKATHRCDDCDREFHGPYQGSHLPMVRNLTYQQLAEGWKNGEVDATWFCIDCWAEKY